LPLEASCTRTRSISQLAVGVIGAGREIEEAEGIDCTADELDTREKKSIVEGLYYPASENLPPVHPTCSSGDCRWPNFNSLAVCATTAEITDKLIISPQISTTLTALGLGTEATEVLIHNASLPNGIFLAGGPETYNFNMSSPLLGNLPGVDASQENFLPSTASLAFPKVDGKVSGAIANAFIIYTNQTFESRRPESTFRAAEVMWHFCVSTYSTTVARGVSTVQLVNSSTIVSSTAVDASEAGVSLRALFDSRDYIVKRNDVRPLHRYMTEVFIGTYSYRYAKRIAGATPASHALGAAMFNAKPGGGTSEGNLEQNVKSALANVVRNVAVGLTNS